LGRESWPQRQLRTDITPIAGVYVKTPKILIELVRGRIGLIPRQRRARLPRSLPALKD
jgi:hypothetical protein